MIFFTMIWMCLRCNRSLVPTQLPAKATLTATRTGTYSCSTRWDTKSGECEDSRCDVAFPTCCFPRAANLVCEVLLDHQTVDKLALFRKAFFDLDDSHNAIDRLVALAVPLAFLVRFRCIRIRTRQGLRTCFSQPTLSLTSDLHSRTRKRKSHIVIRLLREIVAHGARELQNNRHPLIAVDRKQS